ncbi:MAG TPA: crossover junction endodeoxyribonuclease RuvC [Chloroflexota bacterium]
MTGIPVRVLGIDPGSARMGYGVVDSDGSDLTTVTFGCMETSPDWSAAERLHLLHQDLTVLLERFAPQEVAIEELFFAKNARTAISVAQARGVALLAAAQFGCRIAEYTPLQVKVGVVGYGRAEKAQVQHMVTLLLHLAEPPRPDDTADALAVAICHCFRRQSLDPNPRPLS